ncbi:unnamed protein product [Lupinus luteus]|uniref:Uncharacterized protein n=1 Tax=Lupinus luteus TaxID=3873 RepID=A0AAV1YH30_LUPLU
MKFKVQNEKKTKKKSLRTHTYHSFLSDKKRRQPPPPPSFHILIQMISYVGKATKIFIVLLTVLVVFALILGFRLLCCHHHNNTNKCSSRKDNCFYCNPTISSPPPPTFLSSPNFNMPTPPYSFDNLVPPPPYTLLPVHSSLYTPLSMELLDRMRNAGLGLWDSKSGRA